MNIQLGTHRITSDACNIILEKLSITQKEDAEPPERWRAIGFYPNIKSACIAFREAHLKGANIETWQDLIDAIEESTKRIEKACEDLQ